MRTAIEAPGAASDRDWRTWTTSGRRSVEASNAALWYQDTELADIDSRAISSGVSRSSRDSARTSTPSGP
jgi:hypothetical protein